MGSTCIYCVVILTLIIMLVLYCSPVEERVACIKAVLHRLPKENYKNLWYESCFG